MAKFITEDDIEQEILKKLKNKEFNYDIIICDADPNKKEDLNDGTERRNKKECILPNILKESLMKINPNIMEPLIDEKIEELSQDFTSYDLIDTNYKLYNKLRNGIKLIILEDGVENFEFIKLVDFKHPENNTFTAVSQMWIQGRYNWRRPDILIFVNGLPLVFIELKNSIIKIEEAYNKNLKTYLKDIPNLFAFNQICVLSNGLETKLGAFSSTYEFFFEWLKVNSEKEKLDRKAIKEEGVSINYFIDGLLKKDKLIDYIENFILFNNQRVKIIAKNHQYLGVNNLIESVKNREKLQGKLGVFWHTQGSGKTYSMVMFTRKVRRKINGNFTFLIITDREDLNRQIHKNFVRTEVIGPKDECEPKSGEQLRDYLTKNKEFIFTLIQKFRYEKTKKFPVLSERNDILVLVDEAHRTQYKDLAENMRTALPNANYIAFTGTPLLGSKRLTNQWFGDYVSEYNFAQSVEDGSTVPIFYDRRVPEVGLTNDFLDDDILEIIEDENLNEDEQRTLENSASKILEVIKRDDRLDKIAKDIAYHFPRRGFLGKGMVVSVDKFTAVKMYDKVQFYWNEEKKKLINERNSVKNEEERKERTKILEYMNNVEMAVIISEENGEEEKFRAQGLDITKHRKKMNELTPEGANIEDRFKDPNDNLQLVFVCAMWLTGFDVKNLSTLYLDKPMKSHTLMQAIARTNRIYPNKTCGLVVDYINVFKFMKQALSDYATGDEVDYPAKDIKYLVDLLNQCVDEADIFLQDLGININSIINESSTFDKLEDLRKAYNIIVQKDENKGKFKVITNTMINLYDASKPQVFEMNWKNDKFSALDYLHGLLHNTIDDEKIKRAKIRLDQILDSSVTSNVASDNSKGFVIHRSKVIDLSKIDTNKLKDELKNTEYKAIEIDDLKEYLEKALESMINKNCTRIKFSERFKSIIDRYNAGGTETEEYYNQLVKFVEELQKEQERAKIEDLTEEELEMYDLLVKGKKLTKAEEQSVKLAAKNLYKKLTSERDELLVVDWYKDEQPKLKVKSAIETSLNNDLPESYDKEIFNSKINLLLNHFIDMAVQAYGWIANKVA